jgi:hypothetical protein
MYLLLKRRWLNDKCDFEGQLVCVLALYDAGEQLTEGGEPCSVDMKHCVHINWAITSTVKQELFRRSSLSDWVIF